MNALNMAQTAYTGPEAPIRTPRSLEYEVLARVTRRLKSAASDAAGGFPALAQALHDNCRLWTLLASDVADPGNTLPAPLRARLFYLNQFTQQHSRGVLAGEAAVGVLVDINTAVMRGLRNDGGGV